MKLGIIRFAYTPYGGAEKSIERIFTSLSKSDCDPVEITLFSSEWPTRSLNRFNVVNLPVAQSNRTRRHQAFERRVKDAIRQLSLDLVQTHERIPGFDVFRAGDGCHAAWLRRRTAVSPFKTWFTKRDSFHRTILDAEAEIARDPNTLIVSNSSLVYREFCEHYNVDSQKIIVIPNAIDTNLYAPVSVDKKIAAKKALNIPPENPVILFVGSDYARKGVDILMNALLDLRGVYALVIGKDKSIAKLRWLTEKNQLSDRVLLLGAQSQIHPFLSAADLFCLPSLYDSFPNAALEAMSYDIPCIMTPGVGIAEEVSHLNAGMITERNSEALSNAIATLIGNLDNYKGKPRKMAEQYDERIIAHQWIKLYRSLIERKS